MKVFKLICHCCFFIAHLAVHSAAAQAHTIVSPVDPPIRLSGTFGELRSDHFHYGIDIKSRNGKNGQPIYAVADGYISHISVQWTGLGNGLYVTHEDGYISVYGHMSRFRDDIQAYVRAQQYDNETSLIQIDCSDTLFRIKSGDIIGYMGSTGYSFGPHLHFEMRDFGNSIAYNPLAFGLDVIDDRPPLLDWVHIYGFEPVYGFFYWRSFHTNALQNDTLNIPFSKLGLAVHTIDVFNGYNRNGTYKIEVLAADSLVYRVCMDSIALNADMPRHSDASLKHPFRGQSQLLFSETLDPNRLYNAYHGLVGNDGSIKQIQIRSTDFKENSTSIEFFIRADSNYHFPNFHVANPIWPNVYERTAYGDYFSEVPLISKTGPIQIEMDSAKVKITPFHTYIAEPIKIRWWSATTAGKRMIMVARDGNVRTAIPYGQHGDTIIFETKSSGIYELYLDTIPPNIELLEVNDLGLTFRVDDNVRYTDVNNQLTFECRVDDQWVPVTYHPLKHHLVVERPRGHKKQKCQLRVRDVVGNINIKQHHY